MFRNSTYCFSEIKILGEPNFLKDERKIIQRME